MLTASDIERENEKGEERDLIELRLHLINFFQRQKEKEKHLLLRGCGSAEAAEVTARGGRRNAQRLPISRDA